MPLFPGPTGRLARLFCQGLHRPSQPQCKGPAPEEPPGVGVEAGDLRNRLTFLFLLLDLRSIIK